MLYYSYTLMFSLVLQHCCYVVVCCFVRSLVAFVCQEIKELLTNFYSEQSEYSKFTFTAKNCQPSKSIAVSRFAWLSRPK